MKSAFIRKYLTVFAVVLTTLYIGSKMRPHSSDANDFNLRDFGHLPAIEGGRHKPLDTVARTTLMMITHRQEGFDYNDHQPFLYFWKFPKRIPPMKWLADTMITPLQNNQALVALFPQGARKMPAWDYAVFRIDNDQLNKELGLKWRAGFLRYSINDLIQGGQMGNFFQAADMVKQKDPKKVTLLEAKTVELAQNIQQFIHLSSHSELCTIPIVDGEDTWIPFYQSHSKFAHLPRAEWPKDIEAETYGVWRDLLTAYDRGDVETFNSTLAKHLEKLRANDPAQMRRIGVEVFFNEFAPFYHCLVVYAILAVLCGIAWVIPAWTQSMQRACYAAMGVTFLFHLSGLILRMYLQERYFVFVTNLYSSAVFIGLGCVFFCLIVEAFFKNGIAIIVGCVGGFCTLIIAHMLGLSGDTLEMMQAVLDTNFWLATHVTCITLGYVTAFVAGLMGIAYIFLGMFTNMLRKEGSANLTRMTYGVLCAGMFLSFVGTVLGGLWADYSWGRFWGWDPKENGALLIVLWIAMILHARWGGMVKHRGIAVLSVLGIIITSWSWFGTNFLGVGLHSYGFRQGAMASLIMIDLGFLAIAGLGCVPLEMWKSFRAPSSTGAPPPPPMASRTQAANV